MIFSKDNAERIIIAIHGWRSTWNYDFNGQYQFLADNNCSILFIESRAHGESEGRYMYYGKKERLDLLLWIKFVRENISKNLPIYIYGMSVGATTAIMASADITDNNVLGIIADSASTSARDAGKITIKNIHLSSLLFLFSGKTRL
ncbi:MAG: lysophospholipase [Eubacterium sp.]|nr:lysophospholipase [Eubacterium sp.]